MANTEQNAVLKPNFSIKKASLCTHVETEIEKLSTENNTIKLKAQAQQLVTVRVE